MESTATSRSTTDAITPAQSILNATLSTPKRKQSKIEDSQNDHYTERVKDRRLQLSNPDRRRPISDSTKKFKRRREVKSNTPTHALSKTKRRHRGLEGLDSHTSYTALLPLHEMWKSYIQQFLSLVKLDENGGLTVNTQLLSRDDNLNQPWKLNENGIQVIQAQVCKADLLAASLTVIRCTNPSFVGMKGLVAKETQATFVIAISGNDKFKIVPKRNTTFALCLPLPDSTAQLSVPLQGNQLGNQMVMRATKKWKTRRTMDY